MKKNKNFYITTTLPYVNADPHIGFGLEITEADVITRYQRLIGTNVIFNTGTDEHGQKIYQKAKENNQSPQSYCDYFASKFKELKKTLNLSYTNFIRTTDENHIKAAQFFWKKCLDTGDIYKGKQTIKYCVGCELEKTDSELKNGKCPYHPDKELEIRTEENYFFRFSRYQNKLLDLYNKNPNFVKPAGKLKEIKSFVKNGLNDFSISRLKKKMPWGIPVPNDEEHVMYVWFDALINYISTLGWPDEVKNFNKYWPGVQVAGKDNLRQQSAMWQAMLLSANLPTSKQILINGFINVNGQKMSKSLGNVIAPSDLIHKYGVDASRFLLINLGVFSEDMDISWKRLDTEYTAFLSNGLGNLCSRVAKMCENNDIQTLNQSEIEQDSLNSNFKALMVNYELTKALQLIIDKINKADAFLSEKKPWLLKNQHQTQEKKTILLNAIQKILSIAYHLLPFMPETAQKMIKHFTTNSTDSKKTTIEAIKPLFPRI